MSFENKVKFALWAYPETLKSLHAMCVNEVRKINGIIDYEDAVEYQKD